MQKLLAFTLLFGGASLTALQAQVSDDLDTDQDTLLTAPAEEEYDDFEDRESLPASEYDTNELDTTMQERGLEPELDEAFYESPEGGSPNDLPEGIDAARQPENELTPTEDGDGTKPDDSGR